MSSLLRSTKFVRYFTGAARTIILNSAKSAESNSHHFKSLSAVNNLLTREYATAEKSKKSESLEPLLQKLDLEVRRYGRIAKRDIDEVFDELKSKNDITSSQSLLVIRCCGELVPEELPEKRTLLVQKIWNVLMERGIPMDISHYNALLRVYIENEHQFSPAQFLEELEKKGLQPNRVTYQRLMWRYCQEGDVVGATKVLEKMRTLNFPVSEPVLNALVMGHAFHGDAEGAKAVLETMAAAGLQPTNRTYALLACGYARQGDIENVQSTIKTANDKDAYMTDKDILDIIEHLSIGGHGDKVEQLFSHLQKGAGYNQDVCNLILRLLNRDQEDVAKKIMRTMPTAVNTGDTNFKGAFFVKHLLKLDRSPDSIVNTCKELMNENLVPNALYIATECALQQGRVELSQKLFKELQNTGIEIREHYYWPLLVQKGKENDEEGLLQILRNMAQEGITPTAEALRDYAIPYLMKKDKPQNIMLKLQIAQVPIILSARNLMVELLHSGRIKDAAEIALQYQPRGHYSLIGQPLVNALNKTKDIDSFIKILHVISSNRQPSQNDEESNNEGNQNQKAPSHEIGRIVQSAIKNLSNLELAEKLLEAAHSKGLSISTESAEKIEQCIDKDMTTKLSELLTKLTSSDLELAPVAASRKGNTPRSAAQLELLISQVKSRDSNNNVSRLQKQLLLAYIKENNVEKVNKFLQENKSSDFEIPAGILAQLYEFYCQNDNIEKAKEIKAELTAKNPDFVLNKFKLVQMSYALVRANNFDEAIQHLKENKIENEENMGFLYNSKCWQLLNYLAEQKDIPKVKEMTKTLIENNFIEPSNVLLGPSIKVHLLNNDAEGALEEFERCCKQYRSTPWKGELMKTLIMNEDASKLQWLADLSTQIHGEVNILHDLVLAFVECGRLRQARRILETPGLHTRPRRLEDACQRYVEEGKSEYLEGLLEATKELSHIDRSNIFYHLLVTYCKADETDKALGLWTLLQEEGEIPSDQFLIYLSNYLKTKNREVPFVTPVEPEKAKPERSTPKVQQKAAQANEQQKSSQPTKSEVSNRIENLVKENKFDEAVKAVIKATEDGVMPKPNVLKFTLKNLAENGNVAKIEQLGQILNDSMRRSVTYDDKLTLAIFKQGKGDQHIDSVLEAANKAETDTDLEDVLKKFPRSNALASVVQNESLVNKCRKIAEVAASKGHLMPANLLWMEYVLAGKDNEADSIWNQWLINANVIVFRRLLQESHTRNEPQLIHKLISALESNKNISTGSFGNVYSRLINLHVMNNELDKAQALLEKAIKFGVSIDQFNKNSVERLKSALEAAGKELKTTV